MSKPSVVSHALIVCLALGLLVTGAHAAQPGTAWQTEWEKTVDAAKKERQVTIYISGYEAILPDFEKEYPEIRVNAVTGRGNQLGQRLLAERRAEKYLADVVSSGANPNYQQFYLAKALDPIRPALILPEVTDPSKWYLTNINILTRKASMFSITSARRLTAPSATTPSWWTPGSSGLIGICSTQNGKAKSRLVTFERRVPAPAIRVSFTTSLS